MKLPLLLFALGSLILGALVVRHVLAPRQPHDPIEYYASWGGYRHPVVLKHRISKDEADALNARGKTDARGEVLSRRILFRISLCLPSERKAEERKGHARGARDGAGI
jgi:hypothetical protein